MNDLPDWIAEALSTVEAIHAVFDQQESGNIAWGVTTRRGRLFVKLATTPAALDGLIRSATLHNVVQHRAIVPLDQVLRSTHGTALVYPWVDGRSLYAPERKRRKKRSGPGRFRQLPVERITAVLDTVYDAHCTLAEAGFVSSDFYDGCLIYDFEAHAVHLIDLDEYRRGAFVLEADRAFGSTRFMAPEEFQRGATLDERTTVYHLGRLAAVLLDEGDMTGNYRGPEASLRVLLKATQADPGERFQTVSRFTEAWRASV